MSDPLSEVLRSVRLAGGVFLEASFTAPWCITSQIGPEDCQPYLPNLVQVIGYHVVLQGRLVIGLQGEPPIELRAGEVVLFPRNDIHVMASAAGLIPVSAKHLIQQSPEGGLSKIRYGGGQAPTNIVCGFLGTQDSFNPLLAALPKMLKLDIGKASSRDWIEANVRFAAEELARGRLASSTMMSKLSEVLLVEAVREYASSFGNLEKGWLQALSDPSIGRVLARIHDDIAAPWSAESLAREAGLSRSAFMERFADLIGLPPIRYLTVWRLEIAKQYLLTSRMGVAQIAHAIGYKFGGGIPARLQARVRGMARGVARSSGRPLRYFRHRGVTRFFAFALL